VEGTRCHKADRLGLHTFFCQDLRIAPAPSMTSDTGASHTTEDLGYRREDLVLLPLRAASLSLQSRADLELEPLAATAPVPVPWPKSHANAILRRHVPVPRAGASLGGSRTMPEAASVCDSKAAAHMRWPDTSLEGRDAKGPAAHEAAAAGAHEGLPRPPALGLEGSKQACRFWTRGHCSCLLFCPLHSAESDLCLSKYMRARPLPR
jgi:hypothetical protein